MFRRLQRWGLCYFEKQRVAIARAIVKNPQLIIADEPTGAIDIETKDAIMELIKALNKSGKTIVLVTHDMQIAAYADKVYVLENKGLVLKNSL
ncbi:MAG: ATP-binding cassette domain-containing protein [Tissierellia bacterium]|nr:ATP-binding cassette domain-containing protein [Tissierellia bacterium]